MALIPGLAPQGEDGLIMTAEVLRDARQQARHACADQQAAGQRCDDVVLVLSELLGNAVRHGQPPVRFTVTGDAGDVLISVEDADPHPPVDPAAGPSPDVGQESGRGMFIVAALSRAWGWRRTPAGKLVWARL